MSKPFSLQPLLEIMQNRTDEATRRLGQLIAAEQNARSRLEMLEQYRQEYADRLRENIAQGITRQALANYQDFLARIEEAIAQQSRAVSQSEANTVAGQQHWREQHTKMKAIDTLSIRHQNRERKLEDKQEQKLLDEYSTRKFGMPQDNE
ncbi:MAG: flagellar export protein FliJ [Azonexus sp.]|nr:flagellar export protein FliJ [Azonexus sp.]